MSQSTLAAALATMMIVCGAGCSSDTAPTHVPGLSITAVTPSSGPAGGGTLVIISGHNFAGTLGVTFGSAPATGLQVIDSTRAQAVTPAHAPGSVNVAIVSGGTSVTLTDAFTYTN